MIEIARPWIHDEPPSPSSFDLCKNPYPKEGFYQRPNPREVLTAAAYELQKVIAQVYAGRLAIRDPLEEVDRVILSSRALLELKEDWDGEGASTISEETWNRAVRFLRNNAATLWEKYAKRAESPSIVPVNDGSIDIHWKIARRELLVNIPPNPGKRATYYGDNKQGGNVVEGDLDVGAQNHWLLVWLSE